MTPAPNPTRGSEFNRQKGVSFHPAPTAVKMSWIEAGGGVRLAQAHLRIPRLRGSGEPEFTHDRGCRVDIRRDLPTVVQRIDPDSLRTEPSPLGDVDVPLADTRPPNLLSCTDLLATCDGWRDVPVCEVADLDSSITAGTAARPRLCGSRFKSEDSMAKPFRRSGFGMPIIDADIDAEVVTRKTVVVGPPRVEKRPTDRMLLIHRTHRPPAPTIARRFAFQCVHPPTLQAAKDEVRGARDSHQPTAGSSSVGFRCDVALVSKRRPATVR